MITTKYNDQIMFSQNIKQSMVWIIKCDVNCLI